MRFISLAGFFSLILLAAGLSLFSQGCGDKSPAGPVIVVATPVPSTLGGRDWNYATLNAEFTGRMFPAGAMLNGKMWVVGGITCGFHTLNDVWSSGNGSTWTQALVDNASPGSNQFSERSEHSVLAFNDKLWVIAGRVTAEDIAGLNDVWSSSDGVGWTQSLANTGSPGSNQFHRRYGQSALVFGGKMWVIGGYAAGYLNDVWSSSDGVTWTQVLANNPSPGGGQFSGRAYLTTLVFGGKMWVIGGSSTGYLNDVWSSTDGATRTPVLTDNASPGANQFSQRFGLQSFVYGGAMWILGGSNGSTNYNDVWYSADGFTWTAITNNAAFPGRSVFESLVFNNSMWVIGGDGSTCFNDAWYSPF